MSSKYPYLDIAISVLTDGNQPVNYSFNSAPTIALPSLSSLARHFVNLSDGYVMWQVGGRRAFTYFQLNDEGTTTVLAVTVRMEPDVLMPGRPIVNLLGTIRRTIMDDTRLTHESLMRALSDSGFPDEPLRSDAETDLPAAATGLCCRTYISSTELSNIMAFPRQKEYAPYQGVIIVPATVSMQPDSSIPMITEPIDKALMVVCPENVAASANRVELSDHLTVTYELAGFDPQTVEFEVGTTNRYVRINGPALVVNSAMHAGITFTRQVPYSVESANGSKLETYTILINGRTATRTDGSFEVTNNDFHDGKITIAVSSTNFGSYSQQFTPEELSAEVPLTVVLEPEARKICLRLDFGNGRIMEDSITLEKSTPEYNKLRAGSFHGFRAHRMMGSNPETYNIDLKQSAAPVQPSLDFNVGRQPATSVNAPAITTVNDVAQASAQPTVAQTVKAAPEVRREEPRHQGPVAPVIEKAPSAVWEDRQHKRVAPQFENVTNGKKEKDNGKKKKDKKQPVEITAIKNEQDDSNSDSKSEKKIDMRLIIIGISVIAIALILWWLMLLFSGNSNSEPETANEPTVETIEEVNYQTAANQTPEASNPSVTPAASAAPVAAADDNEKADVEYLNSNNTWKLADLKSEKYRALITAMKNGDIQAVASNPYFSVAGTATNKKALQVVNYLWAAKGTFQEKRNVEKLKDQAKNDVFSLGHAIDIISRYQPAEPNKEPRPGAANR